MKPFRPLTRTLLARVEAATHKPVQFLRDDQAAGGIELRMARDGARFHHLRFADVDEALDYPLAWQAGFILRLYARPPAQRVELVEDPRIDRQVAFLVAAGRPPGTVDRDHLATVSRTLANATLAHLRTLPVGLRIDDTIARDHPELADEQRLGVQHRLAALAAWATQDWDGLRVPLPLLAPLAATALHAERRFGLRDTLPLYDAAGALPDGQALLQAFDALPDDPAQDVALVESWIQGCGLIDSHRWLPVQW
jgi:hypothetical protein